MRVGSLRFRVKLQRLVSDETVQDETGSVNPTYVPMAEVWAAIEPLGGREYFSAQVQSEVSTRIRIRYRPGIDSTVRIQDDYPAAGFGPDIYDVLDVIEDKETGRRELQLMCVKRTTEGFRRGDAI